MRRVRVEVTANDIAAGERDRACSCAIALAAQRAFPDVKNLGVYRSSSWRRFKLEGREEFSPLALLPDEANEFVRNFDTGVAVQPFAFEIEVQE